MSTEENKTIVRRFVDEIWNTGNHDVVDEIIAVDAVRHNTEINGIEAFKQNLTAFRTSFPDVHLVIEDLVAEGDEVAVRVTGRGTHKGELWGVAPTGKLATWTAIGIFRITDGKIVEMWANEDVLGRLQQVGFELIPPKGESKE